MSGVKHVENTAIITKHSRSSGDNNHPGWCAWSEAYSDYTAFDPNSDHPDASSTPDKPRWFIVDVRFKEKFSHIIPLETLKHYPELENMALVRKGNRLSVMPVDAEAWAFIRGLSR